MTNTHITLLTHLKTSPQKSALRSLPRRSIYSNTQLTQLKAPHQLADFTVGVRYTFCLLLGVSADGI